MERPFISDSAPSAICQYGFGVRNPNAYSQTTMPFTTAFIGESFAASKILSIARLCQRTTDSDLRRPSLG